ncbi:type II toxin-antitoxin system Phd/YefM family antitoxin [Opitutaceae bacterium]|nr:type II toxin-antitoxin system Phd/YefM family antitoxin [Opitutaceae bacterium]
MLQINIHEAKTHLSRYAKRVRAGETIELCDRNKPFAQISPLPDESQTPLKFGTAKGQFEVPVDFDDSLPEFENDFYGSA